LGHHQFDFVALSSTVPYIVNTIRWWL